ncbi:lysozyme-like domain-containing protein [Pyronema domesticum]|uniref:Similar to Lysozyme acc. no. Q37896 n=1 Tax=Pyronema omphalodes (strain CBS 100304) TaxID=1076935 RepID=U4LG64_PYROM|nr:lysozyme-like domain-containing protein [Pyronema domesticum]CCX31104.1 Similar to Lysozyme; acc. no. Q37896 [Pyronema omphalodes CBS 100304]
MYSLTHLLTTSLLFLAVSAYPAKETLRCRTSPSTSASIHKTYPAGADIKITCQTTGTKVLTSNVWDKTSDGCYVSDYYVSTGHSGIFLSKCGTSGGPPSGGSGCVAPINAATISLIKSFEGFVPSPKPDPIGLPTVGYGHLCKKKGCAEVKYKFPLTEATAAQLLQDDAYTFRKCVAAAIKDSVTLTDNQYGALVSWAFNVGCGGVQTSTLVKRLNRGENKNIVASQELIKWNKAGNPPKPMNGLTRRRNAEIALFKKASSVQAHPPKC